MTGNRETDAIGTLYNQLKEDISSTKIEDPDLRLQNIADKMVHLLLEGNLKSVQEYLVNQRKSVWYDYIEARIRNLEASLVPKRVFDNVIFEKIILWKSMLKETTNGIGSADLSAIDNLRDIERNLKPIEEQVERKRSRYAEEIAKFTLGVGLVPVGLITGLVFTQFPELLTVIPAVWIGLVIITGGSFIATKRAPQIARSIRQVAAVLSLISSVLIAAAMVPTLPGPGNGPAMLLLVAGFAVMTVIILILLLRKRSL